MGFLTLGSSITFDLGPSYDEPDSSTGSSQKENGHAFKRRAEPDSTTLNAHAMAAQRRTNVSNPPDDENALYALMLERFDVERAKRRLSSETVVANAPRVTYPPGGHLPFSTAEKDTFEAALRASGKDFAAIRRDFVSFVLKSLDLFACF